MVSSQQNKVLLPRGCDSRRCPRNRKTKDLTGPTLMRIISETVIAYKIPRRQLVGKGGGPMPFAKFEILATLIHDPTTNKLT